MMKPLPMISVIVPVFNGARFLDSALSSIWAQRHPNLEVIVVDDGSTDATAQLVAARGDALRYIWQENSGPAAARNTGLTNARGSVIAFLDVDDLWPPHKLRMQLGRLVDPPGFDVVLGRIEYDPMGGEIVPPVDFEDADRRTMFNVHLGGGLYRRDVFDTVGVFDPTLRFHEDHDWFLRAREAGVKITILDSPTLVYRLHSANMTRELPDSKLSLARVLKRSIDRRRQGDGTVAPLAPWSDFDERGAA